MTLSLLLGLGILPIGQSGHRSRGPRARNLIAAPPFWGYTGSTKVTLSLLSGLGIFPIDRPNWPIRECHIPSRHHRLSAELVDCSHQWDQHSCGNGQFSFHDVGLQSGFRSVQHHTRLGNADS